MSLVDGFSYGFIYQITIIHHPGIQGLIIVGEFDHRDDPGLVRPSKSTVSYTHHEKTHQAFNQKKHFVDHIVYFAVY